MVKHVTSGEERYFREWSVLHHLMLNMLPGSDKIIRSDNSPD
jgi:hypothetical protein